MTASASGGFRARVEGRRHDVGGRADARGPSQWPRRRPRRRARPEARPTTRPAGDARRRGALGYTISGTARRPGRVSRRPSIHPFASSGPSLSPIYHSRWSIHGPGLARRPDSHSRGTSSGLVTVRLWALAWLFVELEPAVDRRRGGRHICAGHIAGIPQLLAAGAAPTKRGLRPGGGVDLGGTSTCPRTRARSDGATARSPTGFTVATRGASTS